MELTGNVQGLIDLVGGGSDVDVTPIVQSGTKIATIEVDGVSYDLYAPTPEAPTSVEVTQVVSSGTKIASIEVDGESTDLYAPTPEEPTSVEVTPILTSGEHIADINVNGVTSELYAPIKLDIYSESEVVIGTFLNDILYRRVIVLNSPLIINVGAWMTTSIDISFVKYIVRKEFINRNDGANTGGGSIVVKNNTGYMEIGNEQRNNTMSFDVIVLEYTK